MKIEISEIGEDITISMKGIDYIKISSPGDKNAGELYIHVLDHCELSCITDDGRETINAGLLEIYTKH